MKILKNYISGKWVEAECRGLLDVENPSTGEVLAKVPLSTPAEVNRAIEAAAEAFKTWSKAPVSRRVQPLYKLVEIIREKEEPIARVLAAENGQIACRRAGGNETRDGKLRGGLRHAGPPTGRQAGRLFLRHGR